MPRIVRLYQFGGPENLKIEDAPSQQPGAGEVRLRVEAAGVNRDQFTFMSGQHYSGHGIVQPKLPTRLGYEVAGVVEAVGEGVDRSWIGKQVATAAKQYIFDRVAHGRFVPKVAITFPLERAVDAYKYVESNQQMGRVVITVP